MFRLPKERKYTIMYREYPQSEVLERTVFAENKETAYVKTADGLGWRFYSMWVEKVTAQNGKEHVFNTHEGQPY